ncbi:AAA family ATPase, partial [Bacteriovoracaceae bacterium]|nr:AAA family ATPase [Bacteriovoracaceae bacterium]
MKVRLEKLVISNFRCIGNESVSVDLNDIVVLVGANNTGKSTILRAYEAAVSSSTLSKDDFHNQVIDSDRLPTVELHTLVDEEAAPAIDKWCEVVNDDLYRVKEKWVWSKAGSSNKPERIGFRVDKNDWAKNEDTPKKPWATDNVAMSKRPKAHRVGTFDSPGEQVTAIKQIILDTILQEKIKDHEPENPDFTYTNLIDKFETLKKEFTSVSKEELDEISKQITGIVDKIIPNHNFEFNLSDDLNNDVFKIFEANDLSITFGEIGSNMLPVENHGSGARRTLLWAVLKVLAELGYKATAKNKKYEKIKNEGGHLLLIDEPEISLHPKAVRDACNVLYSLPNNDKWQVMITTHSPSFIDLTKDNTTIIRVEKQDSHIVRATTLFRPDSVSLSPDETEELKLMNMINPNTLEFFFGGKVLIVEGDTEYVAFSKVIEKEQSAPYEDLVVIRANGKVQVSSLMKILNHFKKEYFVLHDTDSLRCKRKKKVTIGDKTFYETSDMVNPAWTNNSKIQAQMSEYSTVYASLINFEFAYFGEEVSSNKPANALEKMEITEEYYKIRSLL